MALQQTEFVIQRDEEKEKKEMEYRRRKEREERRQAEKEVEEKEDNRKKERDSVSNRMLEYEARLARIEKLISESLALQDRAKKGRRICRDSKASCNRESRENSWSDNHASGESSRSVSPRPRR